MAKLLTLQAALRTLNRERIEKIGVTIGVSFAIVFLQLLQGILLARLLGPIGRGEYATAVLYTQTLIYMGQLGCYEVICRYAASGKYSLHALRKCALYAACLTGLLTMLVVMAVNVLAIPADKYHLMPLGLVCALSVIGQHIALFVPGVDRGADRFMAFNVYRLLGAAILPLSLLGYWWFWGLSVSVVCWLFVFASLISATICLPWSSTFWKTKSAMNLGTVFRESRDYGFSTMGIELFERFDLVLVVWIADLVTQGFYASMIPVAYPLTIIPNTLGLFLFNKGARDVLGLKWRQFWRFYGIALAVQIASTIGFLGLVGYVVQWVYGDAFLPAVPYAMWLAPVAAVRGITQALDAYLRGRGHPLKTIPSRIAATLVMCVVVLVMHERSGAMAVPQAALAGQVVCLVWLTWQIMQDIRKHQLQ